MSNPRKPFIVKRPDGTYDVLTKDGKGGVVLGGIHNMWYRWDIFYLISGSFKALEEARRARDNAPPVPTYALWDDPTPPQPAVEWKPIAESIEELKALCEKSIDVLYPNGDIISIRADCVSRWTGPEYSMYFWSIIPRPKPKSIDAIRTALSAYRAAEGGGV